MESLADRRWYRMLYFYYEIKNNKTQLYLKTLLPKSTTPSRNLRISKSSTFPGPRTAISWDQIDPNIQNSPSLMSFKHSLLQLIPYSSSSWP